jgi:membrane protein DedA with SNARE-associated domain
MLREGALINAPYTAPAMPVLALVALSLAGIIRQFGYAGLVLLMLVETVFPPIPSEAVLPLAGYFVERGELAFIGVLIATTGGAVLGAVVLYELARHGGRPVVARLLRVGRMDAVKLEEAERWFAKRGPLVVLVGRCIPGVRSVVSLPAGLLRMPRWQYIGLTALGSLVWNTLLVGAGYMLGNHWHRVADVIGPLSTPLVVLAVAAIGGVLLWHVLRRRRRHPAGT